MRLAIHGSCCLVLVAGILTGPTAAHPAQDPLDPLADTPKTPWVLAEDPEWDCEPIGLMYFPKGKLRRVTWSEGDDIDYKSETTEWVKRAMLGFDDRGQCTEVESWFFGERMYRRVLQPQGATSTERILDWSGERPSACWVSEPVRNELGVEIAMVETPWTPDGLRPMGGDLRIRAKYEHDSRGRLLRVFQLDDDHRTEWKRCEIWHDEVGRVSRILYRNSPTDHAWTREFRYDSNGVVSTVVQSVDEDPSTRSWEYRYDEAGRLVEECLTLDGHISSTIDLRFDEDGRLVARSTVEEAPVPGWDGEPLRRTAETFDGIDRPTALKISDAAGRTIMDILWTYENDAVGNWIRRTPHTMSASTRPELRQQYFDIRRDIEYAD